MDTFEILSTYREEFLIGLGVTLRLCGIVWLTGIVFGTVLGVAGGKLQLLIGAPIRVASFILGAVPVLVFLFWLHYPLQTLLGIIVPPFTTATAALAILNSLLVADMIRAVLRDFPQQYLQAARVCGLTSRQTFLRIQLPIVLRQVIPGILLVQVSMLHASMFASLISVDEIFRVAQRINSEVYRPVQIYTALALMYLVVCLPLHGLAYWLRLRYTRDLSER